MAFAESQTNVSLIAESTFASGDLYKFVTIGAAGRVSIGASTSGTAYGTLLSQTHSTSTGANEVVTVGLLDGIGKVYMAGSTLAAGDAIGASSNGFGIAPTTNSAQLGIIVDGSSGSTGRVVSVAFGPTYNL